MSSQLINDILIFQLKVILIYAHSESTVTNLTSLTQQLLIFISLATILQSSASSNRAVVVEFIRLWLFYDYCHFCFLVEMLPNIVVPFISTWSAEWLSLPINLCQQHWSLIASSIHSSAFFLCHLMLNQFVNWYNLYLSICPKHLHGKSWTFCIM